MKARKRKSRARQKPSAPHVPLIGDHGTGTLAATQGTVLEPLVDADGKNPNNVGRVRRVEHYTTMGLSMRQEQAARYIRDAYCLVEMQSSGDALKEQVDTSDRPDATIDAMVDAQSNLVFAKKAVPKGIPERIVEAILRDNRDPASLPEEWANVRAQFKITMDLVANKLRY